MESEDTTTDALDKSWTVIGLMSGTSLDGLDIARARFEIDENGDWHGELLISSALNTGRLWKNSEVLWKWEP